MREEGGGSREVGGGRREESATCNKSESLDKTNSHLRLATSSEPRRDFLGKCTICQELRREAGHEANS